ARHLRERYRDVCDSVWTHTSSDHWNEPVESVSCCGQNCRGVKRGMLHFELLRDRNILVVTPEGPLEKADFGQFAKELDPSIASNGKIDGLMFKAEPFPGWRNVGAFFSHLKFVLYHHQQIERIAVVSSGRLLKTMPRIASHLVHPTIRQFDLAERD